MFRPRLTSLLSVLLLTGCGTFADPTEWLSSADVIEPSPLVELENRVDPAALWTRDIGVGTDGQHLNLRPKAIGDALYVADAEGRVAAFNRADGRLLWERELDLPAAGGPGAGEGLVLIGTSEAEVVALAAEDGSERWRAPVSGEALSIPAVFNGVVVVHTTDGKVFGLEATTGAERWRYERQVPVLTLRGIGSPVIVEGVVYLGLAGGKLVALRADNGNLLWETTVTAPGGRSELQRLSDIDGDPVVIGGGVFVATYQGEVAAAEQRGGRVAWRSKMSVYGRIGADPLGIYAADADGVVYGLDPRTGGKRWTQEALKYRRLSDVVALQG
ncbi:MAG: outer membrane protein assembly factor BamB, partial [Gammaproteobacteria bacterium]|nr:outer membrane protein assembly factor BamB [Gammaproteobacteria bacterium]